MAKCDVCGIWAGLFRSRHADCFVAPKPSPPGPVTLNAGIAAGDAAATLHSLKTALNGGGAAVVEAKRPYRTIYIPQLHPVLMSLLGKAQIEDASHWVSAAAAAVLLDDATLNAGEREFDRWCDTQTNGLQYLPKPWRELAFWAGWAIEAADKRAVELWDDPELNDAFTHFRLDAYACRVPSHAQLDQFFAHRDDAIWQSLWPPNDWLCGCTILAMMSSEAETTAKPEVQFDPKFISRCRSWYQRSPQSAIKLLMR